MTRLHRTLCALVALGSAAAPLSAQSVAEVVEQMYAAYEQHTAGVRNYTLVQHTMGTPAVSYFELEVADGHPLFRARRSSGLGYTFTLEGRVVGYGDVFVFGPTLVERGRYEGEDTLDGHRVHVVTVDDLGGLLLTGPAGAQRVDFTPERVAISIDADLFVPRGFEFEGRAETEGGPRPVAVSARMTDFRDDQGLLVPYRTVIRIEGLDALLDRETQARLDALKKRLDEMPPVQRELMEEMMAEEMAGLRQMLGEPGEPRTVEVVVREVRVNAGPPGR